MLSTKKLLYKTLEKLNQPIVRGRWTPKIYDNDTAKGTFSTDSGVYYDVFGVFRIFYFAQQTTSTISINTMLQIRGDAMTGYAMVGGNLYVAGATNALGGKTIQAADARVYIRPNYTGTINTGWWSGWFLGIKNSWL